MKYYCIACLQHKEHTLFKMWIRSGKAKVCRCDSCHDTDLMIERQELERKAKAAHKARGEKLPLTKKAAEQQLIKRGQARRSIEDIQQAKIDADFVGGYLDG